MSEKECPFCGEKINENAFKCKYCGEWLNKTVPHSLSSNQQTSENSSYKTCPYCCKEIPVNAKKCQFCGEWIKVKPKNENQIYRYAKIALEIIIILIGILLECISGGSGAGLGFAFIAVICLELYFLPTTIADNRRHRHTTIIFIINLFFGYTVIGWVAALVWGLIDEH
ncbi:superinfection immunity protein [bacterium]|nr:superinfection immunity protein [bacterium]